MDFPGYHGETRKDGVPHGYGTITFPNGNRYEGRWLNGKRTGIGKYIYSNGSQYDGEVYDGHLHGKGVLIFANGNHYHGEFRYGKREGTGVFTWHDGEKYEGGFKNDKRDGHGTYYYANKDVYKGRFSNGLKHGYGSYYYSNGDKYEGNFKEGQRHGHGILEFANGDRYEGEFKNDKQNGLGFLIEKMGNKYEGHFKNDKKHGDGVFFRKEDGTVWQQQYKNGTLLSSVKLTDASKLWETGKIDISSSKLYFEVQRDVIFLPCKSVPYKVALKIFSYLDPKTLSRACLVCSSWKRAAEADSIWQEFTKQKWVISERELIKNWKKAYISKLRTFPHDVVKYGYGTYPFRNGNRYEGQWENNQRHGYGRMIYYANTGRLDTYVETYEGEWNRGKKHGNGRYIWSNGDIYEGEFTDGRREGRGVMIAINNDRYEGEWRDGQLYGFGKVIKAKYVYEGDFVNGEKDGIGVITYDNNSKYEGGFKNGNKNGAGRDISPNGTVWEGEYFNGKRREEDVGIPQDQAPCLDWEDLEEDLERIHLRQERRKKLARQPEQGIPKRRRKKPPFVMPTK